MKIGNGLVSNFVKLSLDESEFTQWLERKPLRYALFMQVLRRASKNKMHHFMMSKTEHKKFGLSKSQAGQIERFLDALERFKCVQKTGTNQEPGTFETGTEKHHTGATIYRLLNNEFIDLSKSIKIEKQEPKKDKTGTNQEGSREEINTLSLAGTIKENKKSIEQNTFGAEKTRMLIEDSKNEPAFPKVPEKGFSPKKRSEALTSIILIAKEYDRLLQWDAYEQELAEAVDLYGLDNLLENFREHAEYCKKSNLKWILWDKFKEKKLNNALTRSDIEKAKKLPEYTQDQERKWQKRGTTSYTTTPNMQPLASVYRETINKAPEKTAAKARVGELYRRFKGLGKQNGIDIEFVTPSVDLELMNVTDDQVVHAGMTYFYRHIKERENLGLKVEGPVKISTTVLKSELTKAEHQLENVGF